LAATVVQHPLVQARLTELRNADTSPQNFRRAVHQISQLLLFEATKNLVSEPHEIRTPMAPHSGSRLAGPTALVPILRAGLGMLNGMIEILVDAQVGHIGLARDEETARSSEYYHNLPPDIATSQTLLLDPMLATGGTGAHAADILKRAGASRITLVCIIASEEGLCSFGEAHPDIPVVTAAIDPILDERSYIIPGLGDAGDRYFGTI